MADAVRVSQEVVEIGYVNVERVRVSHVVIEVGYAEDEGRVYGPAVQCN